MLADVAGSCYLGRMSRHPLEAKLNASAQDILTAIERGFRTQVDVKGKLAELFLSRKLDELKDAGVIERYAWQDVDGKPDFVVEYRGRRLVVECKNIRNEIYKRPPSYKVELQRTRNSMDGTPTRGYGIDEFDVLGVALFNQTGRWDYLYIATKRLERRQDFGELLKVMQRVPMGTESLGHWSVDPVEALDDALP